MNNSKKYYMSKINKYKSKIAILNGGNREDEIRRKEEIIRNLNETIDKSIKEIDDRNAKIVELNIQLKELLDKYNELERGMEQLRRENVELRAYRERVREQVNTPRRRSPVVMSRGTISLPPFNEIRSVGDPEIRGSFEPEEDPRTAEERRILLANNSRTYF